MSQERETEKGQQDESDTTTVTTEVETPKPSGDKEAGDSKDES